ncbi:MAG TPA: SRPBCC family protein, partial [Polyangiaceae bacterium]
FGPFATGEIKERLVQFDPVGMALAYESAAGMSSFVGYEVNRWAVQPKTQDRCMVRTHATLELSGPVRLLAPLLKRKLEGDGARVLEELRYRVERGCPHPRKLAAA